MGSSPSSSINHNIRTTRVDLSKYVGPNPTQPKLWYEIYSTQPWFSKDLYNITASYYLVDNQTVSVTNAGFRQNGTRKESKGTAKTVRCQNNLGYNCKDTSRFDVRFSIFQPENRNRGNYWIIDAIEERGSGRYDYALVVSPDGSMIWFLSSTPQMPDRIVRRFMEMLKQYRVETSELRMTRRQS